MESINALTINSEEPTFFATIQGRYEVSGFQPCFYPYVCKKCALQGRVVA